MRPIEKVPLKSRKVLILEDDRTLEPVLRALLASVAPGIKVDWVTSGEDAIARLEGRRSAFGDSPYDLVIADIFLEGNVTGVDFWDLCRYVYPEMPAIVMSGLPLQQYSEFVGEHGIKPPYLQKPLSLASAQAILSRSLFAKDEAGGAGS